MNTHKIDFMRKFLFLALVVFAFTACEKEKEGNFTGERGVTINGVKWATRNVDKPGRFAKNPEDAGMFYQWNRKVGWSATDPLINSDDGTVWDDTMPEGTVWEKAHDPCPTDWRVPTLDEVVALLATDKVSNEFTVVNSINGCKFTDKATGNSIFLPTGLRFYSNGALYITRPEGDYWSSTPYGNNRAYRLSFLNGRTDWGDGNRTFGFSIRCVAE